MAPIADGKANIGLTLYGLYAANCVCALSLIVVPLLLIPNSYIVLSDGSGLTRVDSTVELQVVVK